MGTLSCSSRTTLPIASPTTLPQGLSVDPVSGIITADGGVVDSTEAWGRRRLAYEINNLTDGDYTVVEFHAPTANVAELDRVLHITDPVVRFMIVRRDDVA